MGIITTVADALRGPEGGSAAEPEGAYWCHDCGERVPDADVDGDEPPACPGCGEAMVFERSPDAGACAC